MATTIPFMVFSFDVGDAGTAWTLAGFAASLDGNYATAVLGASASSSTLDAAYGSQAALSVLAGMQITAVQLVCRCYSNGSPGTFVATFKEDQLGLTLVNGVALTNTSAGSDQTFNATFPDGVALASAWSTASGVNLKLKLTNNNDGPATGFFDFIDFRITYGPIGGGGVSQTTVLRAWDYACGKGVLPTLTTSNGVAIVTGIGSVMKG